MSIVATRRLEIGAVRAAGDAWRQDLFADLFRSIHLRSCVWFRTEYRAPWGFSYVRPSTLFHVVTKGDCRLEVKRSGTPLRLSTGDLVIVPRGDWHTVKDAPATRPVDFFGAAERLCADERGVLRAGGAGAVTQLVCGGMEFEDGATNPLLAVLPRMIHVPASNGDSSRRLRLTVEHIIEELDSDQPGAESVITRLANILFIEGVRVYLDENKDAATSGWLSALRDHEVGQAVALLHAQPHERWTVTSLAHRVALSRSAFAARFVQLVGEPPLRYLTRLRLNGASGRLRSSNAKLSAIAPAAGYESVAAFVKAFKRHVGVTPGEYRRVHQDGRPASLPRDLTATRRTRP